jgi:hypothetical protein
MITIKRLEHKKISTYQELKAIQMMKRIKLKTIYLKRNLMSSKLLEN